jgi:hypothetical protein
MIATSWTFTFLVFVEEEKALNRSKLLTRQTITGEASDSLAVSSVL